MSEVVAAASGPLHYPVALVVAGRPCLVVGGGPIAARKVRTLLECGAGVTVVAPSVADGIRSLARSTASDPPGHGGTLTVELRPYQPGEAAGFRLVVTATGVAAVDELVARDAEAAGVWVNSADDIGNCTFLLPAIHRDGPVTVAVSTGGASPALAAWLRTRLAELAGPGLGVLADLLAEARQRLHSAGRSTESVDWPALLDERVVPLVRSGHVDQARAVLHATASGDPWP